MKVGGTLPSELAHEFTICPPRDHNTLILRLILAMIRHRSAIWEVKVEKSYNLIWTIYNQVITNSGCSVRHHFMMFNMDYDYQGHFK